MDLGKTALGNWKAQQGGCTHIQVRVPFKRSYSAVGLRISQGRSNPPPFPFFFTLQFFNEINDLKYVFPRLKKKKTFPTPHPPSPASSSVVRVVVVADTSSSGVFFNFKVHQLWHGILETLSQAKPPHGSARCSDIKRGHPYPQPQGRAIHSFVSSGLFQDVVPSRLHSHSLLVLLALL
jgi:hypothetical protein